MAVKHNLFKDDCVDTMDLSKINIGTHNPYTQKDYDDFLNDMKKAAGLSHPYLNGSIIGVDLANEEPKKPEEWIWIVGYKGTNSDMSCRDLKYELGKRFEMDEDTKIVACASGFHLCLNLRDVFDYYEIGKDHRFFEVKALVRKSDIEDYTTTTRRPYSGKPTKSLYNFDNRKLVSKAIEFVRECTLDEIFKDTIAANWPEKYKKLALSSGIPEIEYKVKAEDLLQYGYSLPFAEFITRKGRYEEAKAIGSQTDLSMDMKAMLIFEV